MAVDIALVTGIGRYAHRVQQLLAAEHTLGLLQQALQQAELMAREAQGLAAIENLHALQIYLEQRRRHTRADPFENCPDPRRHFPWAERFDHVIIGADLQPHHAVDLRIPGTEEHHWHFAETAQLLAGFKAGDVRQADVEDDQVRRGLALMLQRRLAERQPGGGEAFALQGKDQRVGYRRFVFDNQDVRHGFNQHSGLSAV
ncbi:hypothetical protein NBO_147g0001 [Nosema bombycis CQ1]|uniref:Uncharacterized protein n=1 Tax=Nosema bombycis (strain CQ1 / CVCC 102059) TaxID=578461 RepID=R0MGA5_NOSB1|nr:hypothetical protein NBO_147g0001 [Nosema bombycis CQ1]|eukprot:EOB13170.1 hypothetical protein NBO_147g0001 [Nosema bombycis CQ1]